MTRYWAIRTDTTHNTPYIWGELQGGRLRQGWGRRPEEDLHVISSLKAAGKRLDEEQRQTWRGNRRLLPTERDGVSPGDLIVAPHLPRYGLWTIARVTGTYRFSIGDGRNWQGKPDFGHILPAQIVSDPIPWHDPSIPETLRRQMRHPQRMWSLNPVAEDVRSLAVNFAARTPARG